MISAVNLVEDVVCLATSLQTDLGKQDHGQKYFITKFEKTGRESESSIDPA